MNKQTADNIIQAISRYRQYLLINEWENIKAHIKSYIEDNKQKHEQQKTRTEEPPLKALWNTIWTKKINTPIALLILTFLTGLAIGHWGF